MEVFEKSETVDPEVRAYVYSLVSAIGGKSAIDDGRYVLGDDALACLKDLRRWLKLYDEKLSRYDVKRCLAEANLVKGDLLEILAQWNDESGSILRRKVAVGCLELLTQLTWPLELAEESTTVNHHRHLPYLQLAQVEYKRAILQHDSADILRKAISTAIPAMTIPKRDRSGRDEGIINLLLYLCRNVVLINQPQHLPSNGDDDDISRAATIDAWQKQDIFPLLLTVCSGMGDEFVEQDVIILEILYHLLKGVDPKKIFREDKAVMNDNMKNFKDLLLKEKAMFAGQAKNAPTRHNRFGTMIWVKRDDEKVSTLTGQDVITSNQKTLEKMDSTKQWNKPKGTHKKVERPGENADFLPVPLDAKARKHLREFVTDFLDSGFNPLFTQLRRVIDQEPGRVKPSHSRQFFYLVSWFLKAEEAKRLADPSSNTNLRQADGTVQDTSFAYVASVLTQETFVLLNRTMQKLLDDKLYQDLHTCILAFTQVMHTVAAMAESPSEDDQEIAENIQSRIFYEEQTHDRVVHIVRGYKEGLHGFGYLDACTDLAHVFLRMLERYSKVNVDMYIKSKRRARKKAQDQPKGQATIEGLDDDDQIAPEVTAGLDEIEAHQQVRERKFDFNRFAGRLVNEGCIETFIALTSRYAELNDDQLKRCHRFFYRAAFKMERAILLFRVDILNLFNRMIKGPKGLDSRWERKSATFKEWEEIIKQVFRRCIKKLEERPEMMVEMLFSKIPNTLFYLEHGFQKKIIKSVPRPPAEMEIKPGKSYEEQIGIAVSVLINQGKSDALAWLKNVLASAVEERQSWEDQQEAVRTIEESAKDVDPLFDDQDGEHAQQGTEAIDEADKPRAAFIVIATDTPERKAQTFRDKHLRLLLKVLQFERLGLNDDPEASWIIPSAITADHLTKSLDLIKKFEFEPPVYDDGVSAESLIRNTSGAKRNAYEVENSDDEGDSELDESLFVPGGPTADPPNEHDDRPKKKRRLHRKGDEISEEERQRRALERTQKEKEKDAKIKSALFVTESDDEDDDTRDEEFFRLEADRRGKARGIIKETLMQGRSGHGEEVQKAKPKPGKRKSTAGEGKGGKKRKTIALSDSEHEIDDEVDVVEGEPMVISSRESSVHTDSDIEDSSDVDHGPEEDTPLSSQTKAPAEDVAAVLSQTSGNRGAKVVDSDEEDDVIPVSKVSRRAGRALFIVDDDSD